jgi:hypothetical protein
MRIYLIKFNEFFFFFGEEKYNLLINSDLETLRQDHVHLYVPTTLRWQIQKYFVIEEEGC